jgi:hypothetical protein
MLMIYVSPLTSLERNAQRDRSLMPGIVLRTWRDVNKNIGTYEQAFGNNFVLFKRNSIDHGNTWGLEIDSADVKRNSITFGHYDLTYSMRNSVTNFGQFCVAYDSLNIPNGNTDSTNNINYPLSLINSTMLNVYPNPSASQVNFEFSLAKNQKISIYVYNSLGQLGRKIVDQQSLNAGQYRVIWDGKNTSGVKVSEGVYTIAILSENSLIKSGKVLMFN